MTSVSKNVYIDTLADIVNKNKNKYHRTIKMKPVDINSSTCIDFNKENNKGGPKFRNGDHVRISKYKNTFAKSNVPNWSKKEKEKKILKILFLGYILLVILKVKNLLERFTKKNCKKQIQKILELKM